MPSNSKQKFWQHMKLWLCSLTNRQQFVGGMAHASGAVSFEK
jgi:hypothetical protein